MDESDFLTYWRLFKQCLIHKRLQVTDPTESYLSNIEFFESCFENNLIPELTQEHVKPILIGFLYEMGFAFRYIRHRSVKQSYNGIAAVNGDPSDPVSKMYFAFDYWELTEKGRDLIGRPDSEDHINKMITNYSKIRKTLGKPIGSRPPF